MAEEPVDRVVYGDAPWEEMALSCCPSSVLLLGLWMKAQWQEDVVLLWGRKQEFGED